MTESSDPAKSPKPAFLLPTPQSLSRPHTSVETEFDSGINTSAAWTVSLAEGGPRTSIEVNHKSLSDEEPDDSGDEEVVLNHEEGRPARALYAFEGKPEFRELTFVEPGDELEILREDVGEGWSLVKLVRPIRERKDGHEGEIGLLPHTYYTVNAMSLSHAGCVLIHYMVMLSFSALHSLLRTLPVCQK